MNQFPYLPQQQQSQQFDPLNITPVNGFDPLNVSPQQGSQFDFGSVPSPQFGVPQPGQAPQSNINPGQYQQQLSTFGKFGVGLQAGGALLNGYLGLQQLGVAKDQLRFQKDSFNKNYANQVQTTNTRLEDRQRARVAANPNAESVESYLNRNRVS